jgi:hypothetical protein
MEVGMTFLLATLAVASYIALGLVVAHQSERVVRLEEHGTWRSWLLFPKSSRKGAFITEEPSGDLGGDVEEGPWAAFLFRKTNPDDVHVGYYLVTQAVLPARILWTLMSGTFMLLAAPFYLFPHLKVRRGRQRPKIRVVESDADQATGELLDERKKLVEERHKLQSRLPEVEQRLNELDAELNESDYREAPRGAKAQAT